MRVLRIGVSNTEQAEAVYALSAIPVFALSGWSFSGLDPVLAEQLPARKPYGVLVNRMMREEDLPQLERLLKEFETNLPECIYCADASVIELAGETVRKRIIYRPETLMTNAEDMRFWLDSPIGSVTVSPLLTLDELCAIGEAVPEAEFVIHGHLMMSVSARLLINAWQKRRKKTLSKDERIFLRETTRREWFPIRETAQGTMIFTDYVLDSFDAIGLLTAHGASQFYIDGSFLSTEELIEAAEIYRSLLEGNTETERIADYRRRHPECSEGYYGQETIL